MRAIGRALASLGVLLGWTAVSHAAAPVVLIRPEKDDPVLADAWTRLGAELQIHKFETLVVDEDIGDNPSPALATIARNAGALACIALVRRHGEASVDLWLVDRVTGKTTMRAIGVRPSEDTASVLAIRAVDLLRASLEEYDPGERPPPDVVDVDRRPVARAAQAFFEPRESVLAGGMLLAPGGGFGLAYGPTLAISFRAGDRVDAGVSLAGPMVGATLHTGNGTATLTQEMAWAFARVRLVRFPRFEAGPCLSLGGYFAQAEGRADPPLLSTKDSAGSFVGGFGVYAKARLFSHVSAQAGIEAMGLAPRVRVAVSQESGLLPFPMIEARAGFEVDL